MKFKKIIKSIGWFIFSLLVICCIVSCIKFFFFNSSHDLNPFRFMGQMLLYIFGYGDLNGEGLIFLNLFGLLGLISISLFGANLTMYWRTKDVLISHNIAIWKKNNREYFGSVLIGNKGKNISKLSVSFVAYDTKKNLIAKQNIEYSCPLLVKKGIWKIDFQIEKGFFHEFLKTIRVQQKDYRIYAIVHFVDNSTGQECTRVVEYKQDDIYVSQFERGFEAIGDGQKKINWKQFKTLQKDKPLDDIFQGKLSCNYSFIRLQDAKAINAEAIRIVPNYMQTSGRYSLYAKINFTKAYEKDLYPDFVMAVLRYPEPYLDWSDPCKENYAFEIEVYGSEEITSIQLKIKNYLGHEIIDEEIKITDEITLHSFELSKYGTPDTYSKIREICFTIFPKSMVKPYGILYIDSCAIVCPQK